MTHEELAKKIKDTIGPNNMQNIRGQTLQNGFIDTIETFGPEIVELQLELFPYLGTFSSSNGILFLKGSAPIVILNWLLKRKDVTITPDAITLNGNTITGTTTNVQPTTQTNYKLIQTSNGINTENNLTVYFEPYSYFGVTTKDGELSSNDIKALSPVLNRTKALSKTFTGTLVRRVYAYPKRFGNLTKITDGVLDYTNTYSRIEVTIDGEIYNVYVTDNKATITNFTQIFE